MFSLVFGRIREGCFQIQVLVGASPWRFESSFRHFHYSSSNQNANPPRYPWAHPGRSTPLFGHMSMTLPVMITRQLCQNASSKLYKSRMSDLLHFVLNYGYLVIFGITFAEQIGLPFPALPLLIGMGALSRSGDSSFALVVATAAIASLAADFIWYRLGRLHGRSVLRLICRI